MVSGLRESKTLIVIEMNVIPNPKATSPDN
jgi:hypothetical protein